MSEASVQRRPLYSIGTVSRLTGIKADTLRVWERRYKLGASHKSSSGRRLFTQSDLEHLQLVSALVAGGIRIGDIARSERRTLEALLTSQGNPSANGVSMRKPQVLFIGNALCEWLDEHQGVLASVNAYLLPAALDQLSGDRLDGMDDLDGIVVEVGGLGEASSRQLATLTEALGTDNMLVLYRFGGDRWLREMEQRGYALAPYPPQSQFLASYLKVNEVRKDASQGLEGMGKLAEVKPRLFDESRLGALMKLRKSVECECPKHLIDLVRALADFEEYSASCSVESWQDASLHACVYAYAGQARWLMEKALALIAEEHETSGASSDDRHLSGEGIAPSG
ncbi:MAG: MerR family transcriptional regulator [Halioglobus sp.]|nr:MerR family transcriptional regulator [Halioglobus sp.]